MAKITPETLKVWLGAPDLFIVDLRNAAAWEDSEARIKGAHRLDPAQWPSAAAGDLPRDKRVVLY
jgi:rhodanese-related sulfurtransferase